MKALVIVLAIMAVVGAAQGMFVGSPTTDKHKIERDQRERDERLAKERRDQRERQYEYGGGKKKTKRGVTKKRRTKSRR